MVYVLYTLLRNLVPALVKAYCWQQGQEFQSHKKSLFQGAEAQNGGFGTGQGRGRAGAAAGQQQGQEFQHHKKSRFKGAGSAKWCFWNWSGQGQGRAGQGQGRGSSRAAARAAAGAGFTLRAMIGSAIKKCTPDSREGSIFLIRPVLLRTFPDPERSFLNIKFAHRLMIQHNSTLKDYKGATLSNHSGFCIKTRLKVQDLTEEFQS